MTVVDSGDVGRVLLRRISTRRLRLLGDASELRSHTDLGPIATTSCNFSMKVIILINRKLTACYCPY